MGFGTSLDVAIDASAVKRMTSYLGPHKRRKLLKFRAFMSRESECVGRGMEFLVRLQKHFGRAAHLLHGVLVPRSLLIRS
jgi:hypothetical protein